MNVLVTRPDARGQELVELLNQQQIFALHQPLFTLEAGRELPILPSLFSQLNAGDYVFVIRWLKQVLNSAVICNISLLGYELPVILLKNQNKRSNFRSILKIAKAC